MKRAFLLAVIIGTHGLIHATTIDAPSSLIGSGLSARFDYSWGISIPVPAGETVASASIDFTDISFEDNQLGVLYTDLLNSKNTGVTTVMNGGVAVGDYWAKVYTGANITPIGAQQFLPGETLSFDYVLNTVQLAALNTYLAENNGVFNIGLSPDCHYDVGNISFTYTLSGTTPHKVPDATATALLLAMGLAGLEMFRRRLIGTNKA